MNKPRRFWIDMQDADDEANYAGTALFVHPRQGPILWQKTLFEVIEYSAYQRLDRALEVAMKGIKSSVVIEHVCVKCGADSEHCYVLMDSKTLLAEIEAILKGDHEDNKD